MSNKEKPVPYTTQEILTALEAGHQIDALITIDFETYYDDEYSLSKMTTEQYVRDPRFEVILVGVKVGDAPSTYMVEEDFRKWASTVNWERVAVEAHHAHFDGLILSHHFGIKPGFWFDTLSMARALFHGLDVGGSLAKLAKYFRVGEKGFEVLNAKGKRRADFTPEQFHQYGLYCMLDCDLEYAILMKMLVGYPEIELWLIDTTVRMFTEPWLVLDEPMLVEYLQYEQARKADLLARVEREKGSLVSNDKFAAVLREYSIEPPTKFSPTAKNEDGSPKITFAFAKTDPGMQELLEHPNDEVRWLAEARIAVKSTINETRTQRFLKCGAGGRPFTIYLKYGAAHTLRWGGGDKMNAQNLERIDPTGKNPRKGTLRRALMAPAGKQVAATDSAQIEARGVAWLAEEQELVEAFAKGRDIYSEFATVAYGRPVNRKIKLPDGTMPDDVPGKVGKTSVLGLGYSMGWAKFSMALLAGPMGAPPIQFTMKEAQEMGVDVAKFAASSKKMAKVDAIPSRLSKEDLTVHCAVCEHIVKAYRERYPKIVELWSSMDEVIECMAAEVDGEEPNTVRATFGPKESPNLLRVVRHGLILPNGMTLRYPGLRKSDDGSGYSYIGDGYSKQRKKIYGGLLVENVVQALARIIVGEQMLLTRAAGLKVITSTHDEIVNGTTDEQAEAVSRFVTNLMRRPPDWAPSWPLNAEGGFDQTYGGAK